MINDPYQQQSVERYTGSEQLEHQMHQQLETEQLVFFKNANQPRFEGFGGVQGVKDAARGVVILFILGFIFKYIFHIG
jgi:hypothetical protein